MGVNAYEQCHAASLQDPDRFWLEATKAVDWSKAPMEGVREVRPGFFRWFGDGRLNTCFNALDRHVEAGFGERPALIYESPVTGRSLTMDYATLREQVARFAGVLRRHGVTKGSRVLVYMPMVPEAVVAMLAAARLGAVHCTVFGGFAAPELATRIDDCTPTVIVAASCGIEPKGIIPYKPMVDAALSLARHQPAAVIVLQRPQLTSELADGRDHDWATQVEAAEPAPCVEVAATDPLYILYTSGTTGAPKGVVRDNGGHAVALLWSMTNLFGMSRGDVFWAASDIGWQVGHTYTVYAPLLFGCATVLYEGKPVGTPDAAAFWRLIDRHRVSILLTAPTAIRAIRRIDPQGRLADGFDLSSLRALFLAGERSDPDTLAWAETITGAPVIDHWWQTESGWPISGNPLGLERLPVKHGSVCRALPGWDVQVLDEGGHPARPGESGAIAIRLPMPPGAMLTLWNADKRFADGYLRAYPGYFNSGDTGFIDADGYIWVMARADDVINVAGHRFSTGAIEEVLCSHPSVAEAAVVGVADALKGQLPVGLLVLKSGAETDPDVVVKEVLALVVNRIGSVASFQKAVVVDRLPKTRSGKTLRATIKKIADGETVVAPATIDDATSLAEIEEALRHIGYARTS